MELTALQADSPSTDSSPADQENATQPHTPPASPRFIEFCRDKPDFKDNAWNESHPSSLGRSWRAEIPHGPIRNGTPTIAAIRQYATDHLGWSVNPSCVVLLTEKVEIRSFTTARDAELEA